MEENVLFAALAGLLHDIGKFAQRAGVSGSRIWDAGAKKEFGFQHALLTGDFVSRWVPTQWRAQVRGTAGGRLGYAVALADCLSAGEQAQASEDDSTIHPQMLPSIFCSVKADDLEAPQRLYWPLAALSLDEKVIFPREELAKKEMDARYSGLWLDFEAQAKCLSETFSQESADLQAYLESMWLLFQRYTWCIPSASYPSGTDVSLYDHARVTAMLATVLQDSSISCERLAQLAVSPHDSTEPLAMLVCGDLSGLQSFLYTISARGATSALRGRSYYLQLLTEAAARYLLRRLNLPVTNLLYIGGGTFYLLARSTDAKTLETVQNEVDRVLYAAHRGDLHLSLGAVALQAQDFFNGRISRRWGDLADEIQRSKMRRFAGFGKDLSEVFVSRGHGGSLEQQCSVCGSEDPHTQTETREGEDDVRKCRACASYENLGDDLREASYLVIEEVKPQIPQSISAGDPAVYSETLEQLGMKAGLWEQLPSFPAHGRRTLLALKDSALAGVKPFQNQAIGRRLAVNVTPLLAADERSNLAREGILDLPPAGSIKPFHVLEHQSNGIKRLGVLRMDVDHMGRMFSQGLGSGASLSRMAALSFAVSLYFDGWVGVLGEEINRESGGRLYSIYSGGDDLFFVGAWDAVVELARRVRIDLTRFAAGHPGIHASAGITLVGGKYPLAQAAQDAGEAEEAAKHLRWFDGQKKEHAKDAVSFLGRTVAWPLFGLEGEKEEGLQTVHGLMLYLSNREKLHPVLRKLIHFQEMYEKEIKRRRELGLDQTRSGEPQALYGRWNWLAAYNLQRAIDRYNEYETNASLQVLKNELSNQKFNNIEWIGLSARWAELTLRRP